MICDTKRWIYGLIYEMRSS